MGKGRVDCSIRRVLSARWGSVMQLHMKAWFIDPVGTEDPSWSTVAHPATVEMLWAEVRRFSEKLERAQKTRVMQFKSADFCLSMEVTSGN